MSGDGVESGVSSEDLWQLPLGGKHGSQSEVYEPCGLLPFSKKIREFFPP